MDNQNNQINLIVYHNVLDAFADCICEYDVEFKMSKLTPGNYHLKVYYAGTNMQYDETDVAYNGKINLTRNDKVSVILNSEMILPER